MQVKFSVIEKIHASMNPCGKLYWKLQEGEGGGREESVRVNWNFLRGGTGSWNDIIRKCNIAVTNCLKSARELTCTVFVAKHDSKKGKLGETQGPITY